MPISFIIVGLVGLYYLIMKRKSAQNIAYTIILMTLSLAFMTKFIVVTPKYGINTLAVVCVIFTIIIGLKFNKINFSQLLMSLVIALLYMILCKINIEYHYVFNWYPIAIITIALSLFCKNDYDCVYLIMLANVVISLESLALSINNDWYAVVLDTRLISLAIYEMSIVLIVRFVATTFYGMFKSIKSRVISGDIRIKN